MTRRRAAARRALRRAAHAARPTDPARVPRPTGNDPTTMIIDEVIGAPDPLVEYYRALLDEDAAVRDFYEQRRAPQPIRALEAVIEREGVPTDVARSLARRVIDAHLHDPDTRDTWVAIYYDGVDAARSWLRFSKHPDTSRPPKESP